VENIQYTNPIMRTMASPTKVVRGMSAPGAVPTAYITYKTGPMMPMLTRFAMRAWRELTARTRPELRLTYSEPESPEGFALSVAKTTPTPGGGIGGFGT
jgi:hypothetical protein